MNAKPRPAPAHKTKSRYVLWQETIDQSLTDKRWNDYDCDIKRVVTEFDQHLSNQGGYRPLDWRLIKAMIWTESGGPDNRAWKRNPMQIGNPGDPGLRALLSADEGGSLILPPSVAKTLSEVTAHSSPLMNIRAGTGYLLMRLARFATVSVVDKNTKVLGVALRPGDTLTSIARANQSTVDTLKTLNRGITALSPGMTINCQKAVMGKVIVGWDLISTARIAMRYNVGDLAYARKLNYCLSIMKRSPEGATCAA